MTKKLILIDGYGFVFRAFHSMPALTRPSDNLPIGAVYGFTNMLLRLIEKKAFTHIAVVLDSGSKNFRHEIDPNYKANRPPPHNDLVLQFPVIRDVIEAFNIKAIEKKGFEADDLLATYAKLAYKEGFEVTIVSSDKDLMQLLEHGILMYDAMKDKLITDKEVFDKFGVTPNKIRDVLALIGDSSDNIPGVRGIGPKTAAELINEFGSLQSIYDNIDSIKQDKRKQMLLEDKSSAELSYKLVELCYNAPIDYTIEDLSLGEIDKTKLAEFVNLQGFKSLYTKLTKDLPKKTIQISFTKLDHPLAIKQYIDEIYKCGWLSFFVSANEMYLSLDNHNLVIELTEVSLQASLFGANETESIVDQVLSNLNEVMCSSAVTKITIDSKWLFKINPNFTCIDDIAVMAYALETGRGNTTLEALINDLCPHYKNHDSFAIYSIHLSLKAKLFADKAVALYERIDRHLPKAIAQMEERGVLINSSYLNKLSIEFKAHVMELERLIFALSDSTFNIGSPKQMGEILFDQLKLPGGKKSKLGAYATGVKVLENLQAQGIEIAGLILKWRGYSKLISTYTDALPKSVNPKTGRIHSNFLITLTATGRFSSTEPNLQNIPIRTEEGSRIRSAFIAKPGHKIVSADYSQIELRLLAHYANIPTLKQAFKDGLDIHTVTASQIFNVPINEVDSNMRRRAKTINFGIIYGISGFGLAQRLEIGNEYAKNYIERYFKQYPGIKAYMDETIEFAKKHGYVLNVLGRKCMIDGINNRQHNMRSFAQRAAINAPLQSGAADIIKKAIVHLPQDVSQYLILQIHDELLFEIPNELVDELCKTIKKTMESVVNLSVVMIVDISVGDNWAKN